MHILTLVSEFAVKTLGRTQFIDRIVSYALIAIYTRCQQMDVLK